MSSVAVGVGNALVDILVTLPDDQFLVAHGLVRGTMNLVDERQMEDLLSDATVFPQTRVSGGSAANTVHGLAGLGISCGYVGKIGDDEAGVLFREDLSRGGVEARLLFDSAPTGRAVALISPDGERTFVTYLGAAVHLSPDELTPSLFVGARIVHIEGYLVQDHALLRRAIFLARECGAQVSLDLASHNVVTENRTFLREIVSSRQIDILFANEEEAEAFGGGEVSEQTLEEMAQWCATVVVKRGKEGSVACRGKEQVTVGARPTPCRDTTGAGDLYAAGFLYGVLRDMPLSRCAEIGTILASHVICRVGAKISPEDWAAIRREIER